MKEKINHILNQSSENFINLTISKLVSEEREFFTDLCEHFEIDPSIQGLKNLITHLGYRCTIDKGYEEKKRELSKIGMKMLTEVEIGGRPISTWKNSSINFENNKPFILELIAPKVGNKYQEGLQVVALLLPETNRTELDLQNLFRLSPDNIETSGLLNTFNPHVEITLSSGSVLKFHIRSLEEVIKLEKAIT
jgi:predicted metalloenzyme YecM